MEQCTYSFYDELEEFGPAGEESAARIMTSVFAALAYIHDQGIVHRDVKAANILISATDRRVLLSDFGMAVQPAVEENINWMSGTPGHIAPEILRDMPGSSKIDMFAAGVLLYDALTGRLPFNGPCWRLLTVSYNPDLSETYCSAGVSDLLRGLLQKKPEHRPAAEEAMRHSWFKSMESNQFFAENRKFFAERRKVFAERRRFFSDRRKSFEEQPKARTSPQQKPRAQTFPGPLGRMQRLVVISRANIGLRLASMRFGARALGKSKKVSPRDMYVMSDEDFDAVVVR
ncbi:unnamed protein product [Polarella glacialis]|uniref:Protein kinase domain-containing protein n=1 Tax=Polarella glacialis TaxID=89957 RepID=A0A813HQN5_POLGL|nr:unnamed protein product [Polarella glacialis]